MKTKEELAAYNKAWFAANADKRRAYARNNYVKHKAAWIARSMENEQKVKITNPELHKIRALAKQQAWAKKHPSEVTAYAALRRARKLRATPSWVNKVALKEVYLEAKRLGKVVDHVVPLQGKLVCGLHVPWNLQLLTLSENSRKSNKHASEY